MTARAKLHGSAFNLLAKTMHALMIDDEAAIYEKAASVICLEPEKNILLPSGIPGPREKETQVVKVPRSNPSTVFIRPAVRGTRISDVKSSKSALLPQRGVSECTSPSLRNTSKRMLSTGGCSVIGSTTEILSAPGATFFANTRGSSCFSITNVPVSTSRLKIAIFSGPMAVVSSRSISIMSDDGSFSPLIPQYCGLKGLGYINTSFLCAKCGRRLWDTAIGISGSAGSNVANFLKRCSTPESLKKVYCFYNRSLTLSRGRKLH